MSWKLGIAGLMVAVAVPGLLKALAMLGFMFMALSVMVGSARGQEMFGGLFVMSLCGSIVGTMVRGAAAGVASPPVALALALLLIIAGLMFLAVRAWGATRPPQPRPSIRRRVDMADEIVLQDFSPPAWGEVEGGDDFDLLGGDRR